MALLRYFVIPDMHLLPNSLHAPTVHDTVGVEYLTRLCVSLSHLRVHIFKHNLQDTTHPFCTCTGLMLNQLNIVFALLDP